MKAVFHYLIPDLPGRPILCDLFEEIVVRIEEEAKAWTELVHVQAPAERPLDVLHSIIKRKREFLERCGACLPDVIPTDGNCVEPRCEFRAELEGIHH